MKNRNVFIESIIVLIGICLSLASSCEKSQGDVIQVYARETVIPGDYGQMFVTVKCKGKWNLSLTGEEGLVEWAGLNVASGKGDMNNIILTYHRNVEESSRILRIVLHSGSESVSCELVQLSSLTVPDEGGDEDPSVPETPSVQNPKLAKWLELPAMNDASLDYYSHSFTLDGEPHRNYTFAWDKGDYLAKWVAYPLCKTYVSGNYGGSGDWAPNPQVDYMYQPNFGKSFGYSAGYERGHQIANADRKCNAQSNIQTYYYTNSTLQHKNFNGKIWAKLEGNMRGLVESKSVNDTAYVVTGCVVPKDPEHITDPDGKLVAIPTAYFKAVLSYSPSSTFGTWLSAGFYLEHKTYSYEYITAAETMTVDALEARLGMDFFVNLPAKIGEAQAAAVEAQDPLSYKTVWNIR